MPNDPQLISIIESEKNYGLNYLWAILNSKLATFYHFNSSPKATKGAFPKILVYDVKNFPLPKSINNDRLLTLVNEVIEIKNLNPEADITALDDEIDDIVYKLYGLTPEEIAIVENG